VFGNAGVWSAKLKTMLPAASFADVNLAIPRKSTLLKVVFPSWPLPRSVWGYNGYIQRLYTSILAPSTFSLRLHRLYTTAIYGRSALHLSRRIQSCLWSLPSAAIKCVCIENRFYYVHLEERMVCGRMVCVSSRLLEN